MRRASDTQGETEARGPGTRGWFQPAGRPAAAAEAGDHAETETPARPPAGASGPQADPGGSPDQNPDETAVFPRILAADDELPTAPQPLRKTAAPQTAAPDLGAPDLGAPEISEPGVGGPTAPVRVPAVADPARSADDDELPTAPWTRLARLAAPRASDGDGETQAGDGEPRAAVLTPPTAGEAAAPGRPGTAEPEPDEPETSEAEADGGESDGAEAGGPEDELPDETTVFPRVPKTPPGERPPDITRPQLILDDTMVDIAAVRGAGKPAESGSGGSRATSSPPAAASDAAPADAAPPAAGKPAKKNRSVFGPEPAARPDMLTNAETVVMASLKNPKGAMPGESPRTRDTAANARNAAAVKEQAVTTLVPVRTSTEFAEAATQILPSAKPGELRADPGRKRPWKARVKRDRPAVRPPRRYTPGRRTTRISRLILLAIVILQAVLSLRLHNTAFEDEATYLYAGHMELEYLLHGAALQGQYALYFSGSPVLYPVAGAFLDQIGGLALARTLSLVEMLSITALLYAMTRRLFNERAGLCAAALFAVAESVEFLGNFATYDATCLFLLALAAWITVRAASSRWPWFLAAAVPAALAVAVKYAGLLFVPTIAVLPALAGWPERGRKVVWYPAAFGVSVAGLLYGALRLGGHDYMSAISSTTTSRAQGTTPVTTIALETAEWGGVLIAAAVIGAVAYVRRVRTEPQEKIAPAGGRLRRAALGTVLTGTALLAPAYQAHLHTDISFLKHIGFGLFFAAPMAGFGLARIMGDYFRRPQLGIAVWSLALVLGMTQASYLFQQWPDSRPFVTAFSRYLKPNARYLVEVPEVPIYYLMGNKDAQPRQFTSTYVISYYNKKGQLLTGPAGFTAAVQDGYFQVIAYNNTVTLAVDGSLAKALKASHSYYLAQQVKLSDVFGPVTYDIWVKGHKPAAGGHPAKKTGKP
jgi:hypothetical protein